MNADAIVQFINTCGFPIACTIAMFVMLNKEREEHTKEVAKWVEALNNNTLVMKEISVKLNLKEEKNEA